MAKSDIRNPDIRWSDTRLWFGPGKRADEIEAVTRVVGMGEDWEVTEFTFVGGYEMYEEGGEWIGQTVDVEARNAKDAFEKGVAQIAYSGGADWEGTTEDLIEESVLPPKGMTVTQWRSALRKDEKSSKKGNPSATAQFFEAQLDAEQERLLDALVLIASNDGDAYRHGKNAKKAVDNAFRQITRLEVDALNENFPFVRDRAIEIVKSRWGAGGKKSNPTREAELIALLTYNPR